MLRQPVSLTIGLSMSQTSQSQHSLLIREALERVRERIQNASRRAARSPDEVMLVAVTKTFPAQVIREAIDAGQCVFGENRVEEALPKIAEIGDMELGIRWHLIGHLQSRKVKDTIGHFALIHSVDSVKLAETLNQRMAALPSIANRQPPNSQPQPILLECNVSGEKTKSGFAVAGWDRDVAVFDAFLLNVQQIARLPHVRVNGLMTVAPIVEQAEQARPFFANLRRLRDRLRELVPEVGWEHLSMGMTDDFEAAVAEGATLVRIGRAIFGERSAP